MLSRLKIKRPPRRSLHHPSSKKQEAVAAKKNPHLQPIVDGFLAVLLVVILVVATVLAYERFTNKPMTLPGADSWTEVAINEIKSVFSEVFK